MSASNREISLELGGKQFATAPIDALKIYYITNEVPQLTAPKFC